MRYEIESLAKGGEGIARVNGKTYFIAKTLPGECGEFKIVDEKKSFGRGEVVKCDKVSHYRCKDQCPVRNCNGCGFRHVTPAYSLELKAQAVHQNIIRQAHVSPEVPVKYWPVTEFDGTRRRVRIHVMRNAVGLYIPGTHKIVDISKCLVLHEDLRKAVADIAKNFIWKCDPVLDVQIDLDDQNRAFAHFTVADIEENNQNNDKYKSKYKNKKPFMGRFEKESIANYLDDAISRHVFAGAMYDNRVWGEGRIRDIITISSEEANLKDSKVVTWRRIGRFGQATLEANQCLHQIVAEQLAKQKPNSIYDLFCGAGNFTFRAAMFAKSVTGIEFFGDRDTFAAGLQDTSKLADLGNVTLRLADLDKGLPSDLPPADLVITDPARSGMSEQLCEQIKSIAPKTILYISCEASCLGRDLKSLMTDYIPTEFHYVDMFPRTPDVETVVLLKRNH